MAMPTCGTCNQKWLGKPTATICPKCLRKKKAQTDLDLDNTQVTKLGSNMKAIRNRKPQITSKKSRRRETIVRSNMPSRTRRSPLPRNTS